MTLLRRGAVAALMTCTLALALAGCGGIDEPRDDAGPEVTQADDDTGKDDAGKDADSDDTGDDDTGTDDTGTDDSDDTGTDAHASDPVAGGWDTTAATAGSVAQSDEYDFGCPAGGSTGSPVWGGGDGQYTDDSSICVAAVHAGLITPARGGTVHVTTTEGRDSYVGSTANGVTSHPWGAWGVSFEVSAD